MPICIKIMKIKFYYVFAQSREIKSWWGRASVLQWQNPFCISGSCAFFFLYYQATPLTTYQRIWCTTTTNYYTIQQTCFQSSIYGIVERENPPAIPMSHFLILTVHYSRQHFLELRNDITLIPKEWTDPVSAALNICMHTHTHLPVLKKWNLYWTKCWELISRQFVSMWLEQ